MTIRLDGFAVALPVGLDAFPLYPLKILPGEVGHVPLPGQLAGLAPRGLVKAAALQYAPRCLLRRGRLGVHEKRAAVKYQLGRLELVIERLLFAGGGEPIIGDFRKGKFEFLTELAVVLFGNAGAELLL